MAAVRYPEPEESYEDYIDSTPLEARFDYLTIQLAVTKAFPKHEAYGMSFTDYNERRKQRASYDNSESKRISFYFPKYFSMIATDLAIDSKESIYPFIITVAELGLIDYVSDFSEELDLFEVGRKSLFRSVCTSESKNRYMQIDKFGISLNSASGYKAKGAAHYTPSVPKWFATALVDHSNKIGASQSDMIFFAWCYGIINGYEKSKLPNMMWNDISDIITSFKYDMRQREISLKALIDDLNIVVGNSR